MKKIYIATFPLLLFSLSSMDLKLKEKHNSTRKDKRYIPTVEDIINYENHRIDQTCAHLAHLIERYYFGKSLSDKNSYRTLKNIIFALEGYMLEAAEQFLERAKKPIYLRKKESIKEKPLKYKMPIAYYCGSMFHILNDDLVAAEKDVTYAAQLCKSQRHIESRSHIELENNIALLALHLRKKNGRKKHSYTC